MDLDYMKKLCKMNKKALQKELLDFLDKYPEYQKIAYRENGYIFAEGTLPICLIAHVDTVFNHLPTQFYYDNKKKVLWSPGGSGFDDRAGIYIILKIISETKLRPSIIFTDLEEFGGEGAWKLIEDYKKCPFENCKALIQLDRKGPNHCVFYDCKNKAFEKYINSFGFQTQNGTFSDISIIAPQWGIAAVNLSVGYLDEHTPNERLYCEWTGFTIKKVIKILLKSKEMQFYKYISSFKYNLCPLCAKPMTTLYWEDKVNNLKMCYPCYRKYYQVFPIKSI